MADFQLTAAQGDVIEILVDLIGLTCVHKMPEQGDCIVLHLLPAFESIGPAPFFVRVSPDGRMERRAS